MFLGVVLIQGLGFILLVGFACLMVDFVVFCLVCWWLITEFLLLIAFNDGLMVFALGVFLLLFDWFWLMGFRVRLVCLCPFVWFGFTGNYFVLFVNLGVSFVVNFDWWFWVCLWTDWLCVWFWLCLFCDCCFAFYVGGLLICGYWLVAGCLIYVGAAVTCVSSGLGVFVLGFAFKLF